MPTADGESRREDRRRAKRTRVHEAGRTVGGRRDRQAPRGGISQIDVPAETIMTDEEIEQYALGRGVRVLNSIVEDPRMALKEAIVVYTRERWRLESEAHEARQAHQREVNVLAATAK